MGLSNTKGKEVELLKSQHEVSFLDVGLSLSFLVTGFRSLALSMCYGQIFSSQASCSTARFLPTSQPPDTNGWLTRSALLSFFRWEELLTETDTSLTELSVFTEPRHTFCDCRDFFPQILPSIPPVPVLPTPSPSPTVYLSPI